jgi:putative transcriptional regulator
MTISLQGSFLVSASHLRDPNFYRSVVLMLEHNDNGAMGLVINRPSAMTIAKALSQKNPVNGGDAPVFVGGPVEPTSLFILHNCLSLGKSDQELAPGVFLAGSEDSFDEVVRSGKKPEVGVKFRLISGYAGWGEGQLEGELARGDWHILPADGALVLEEDVYGLWEVCTRRLHRANRLLPHHIRNPEWN